MWHEALRDIGGLAHEGEEVVVDSDLTDEEERSRRDLALICYMRLNKLKQSIRYDDADDVWLDCMSIQKVNFHILYGCRIHVLV